MSRPTSIATLALVILASACMSGPRYDIGALDMRALADEQAQQMAAHHAMQVRVDSLFLPLIRHGFCDETGPYYGFGYLTSEQFDDGLDRRIAAARGIGSLPHVVTVVPTSRAATSGLRAGDNIYHVNGIAVNSAKDLASALDRVNGVANIAVSRADGTSFVIAVEPEIVCPYRAHVVDGIGVNAFADGANVMVGRDMLDFVESDEELQFVLAHELAHNAAGHVDAMRNNSTVGGLIGAIADGLLGTYGTFASAGRRAGMRAYSQDFEREADYLAVYLLARANIDLSGLQNFWRRLAEGAGYQSLRPNDNGSHPSYPERTVRLRSAIIEVQGKVQRTEPLFPNTRSRAARNTPLPQAAPVERAQPPQTAPVGSTRPPQTAPVESTPAPPSRFVEVGPSVVALIQARDPIQLVRMRVAAREAKETTAYRDGNRIIAIAHPSGQIDFPER
ncbi:MAG: M48 family metalloprotease [Gammaproteobacteria bacterium]|nr:M48 family metalloprotease [Gammaproteobacteria bacterium]MYF60271.1 M48 family metalloprotease [Gammaproteobacteria bacterium]MYK42357.1 M48 family metalloprotease [Gemmatimonadota bacterium]